MAHSTIPLETSSSVAAGFRKSFLVNDTSAPDLVGSSSIGTIMDAQNCRSPAYSSDRGSVDGRPA
jgi:hypothetical protein